MYCRTTKFEMRKTALQNTLTLNSYSSNGKQTAERLLTYQVSRCFTVVWSQFWTFSKCLSALETTTNNQEVKRSLHTSCKMWIIYPKIIFACAWLADLSPNCSLYRSCWTSRIHLIDFINISDHSIIINSNILQTKSLIFCCVLKEFDVIN